MYEFSDDVVNNPEPPQCEMNNLFLKRGKQFYDVLIYHLGWLVAENSVLHARRHLHLSAMSLSGITSDGVMIEHVEDSAAVLRDLLRCVLLDDEEHCCRARGREWDVFLALLRRITMSFGRLLFDCFFASLAAFFCSISDVIVSLQRIANSDALRVPDERDLDAWGVNCPLSVRLITEKSCELRSLSRGDLTCRPRVRAKMRDERWHSSLKRITASLEVWNMACEELLILQLVL